MKNKENKMGVMPIRKLVINMSLPIMISMLVQALYNIVDSIFVSQISEEALTAVTLAFPLQALIIAVSTGTGVGFSVILSRALGERDFKKANITGNTGIFLILINFIIFLIVGFFVPDFINNQTADTLIREAGTVYLRYITMLSFGVFIQITMERLLQSTGRAFLSMVTQIIGAVTNIILDPIFIFGLLGLPKMGVAGAAIATILGQCTGAAVGIYFNLKYNKDVKISFNEILRPRLRVIKEIYVIGIPSIVMMSIGSIMIYLMNLILIAFSNTATALFGIYIKLQSFVFMPVFGLSNGLVQIISFNYGAKRKNRIDSALRFAMALAVTYMFLGTLVFELLPQMLLNMFNASPSMQKMGVIALRIIALHFPLAAIGITLGSIFQGLGESIYSLITSIMRLLVALVPVAYLLSKIGNINYVWFAFLISEVISLITTMTCFRHIYTKMVFPLKGENYD